MPRLDVNDLLFDPDFATTFDVTRKTQLVGDDGRAAFVTDVTPKVVGVVYPASGKQLVRGSDGEMVQGDITIVTPFKLTNGKGDLDADVISWNGSRYTIKGTNDYSQFGRGFIIAVGQLLPVNP